jgi:hypothetical protein
MKDSYVEKAFNVLESELQVIISKELEPMRRMNQAVNLIRKSLQELKEYINANSFGGARDEVHFFKEVKPRFYSLYLYEVALYNVAAGKPCGDTEQVRNYYLEELRFVQRTFRDHSFLYQYYRLSATELDELYFVRNVEIQSVLIPEVPELSRSFSTIGDYLFSKFRAFEKLQAYILNEITNIGKPAKSSFIRPGKNGEAIKWTGEQVNLIELGYGLWLSGQINGGEASLADIMYWLGQSLDIDLTRHTRRFDEIKARKLVSQTRFTDQIRDCIRAHIDNSFAFQPNGLRRANRTGSGTGK